MLSGIEKRSTGALKSVRINLEKKVKKNIKIIKKVLTGNNKYVINIVGVVL